MLAARSQWKIDGFERLDTVTGVVKWDFFQLLTGKNRQMQENIHHGMLGDVLNGRIENFQVGFLAAEISTHGGYTVQKGRTGFGYNL